MKARKRSLWPFPATLAVKAGMDLGEGVAGRTSAEGPDILIELAAGSPDRVAQAAAHEAVHAAQALQEWLETEFDDETEAYVAQGAFAFASSVAGVRAGRARR